MPHQQNVEVPQFFVLPELKVIKWARDRVGQQHVWTQKKGSPSMTGAVRESAKMFLPQNVLAKGAPIAPNQTRIYHRIA